MPTYRLERVSDEPRSCFEVQVPEEKVGGSGPDKWTAMRMAAHRLEREARGEAVRERGDYAGGPR